MSTKAVESKPTTKADGTEQKSAKNFFGGSGTHKNDVPQDDPTGRLCQWEEDGMTVYRTNARTAPGCHNNCGLLVYVKDGVIDHIEGDPENPHNQGRLCVRCLAAKEVVYHKDRVLYPMKRAREHRGEDKWERITWDEAMDIVYDKMMGIIKEYGAQSIFVHQGTGRDINGYTGIFAHTFGTPNKGMGLLAGQSCYAPRFFSTSLKIGDFFICDYGQFFPQRYDDPRFTPPGCIMVWGNNPLVANSDGSLGHWVVECMKRGSKLLAVDPKLTWLAGKADVWVPLRPGTDTALALGMCRVILEEGLEDKEFIDLWTYGFEEWKAAVEEYTPEKVAEICWIDPEDVVNAARLVGSADSACLQWGVALDHQPSGFTTGMAAFDLLALTGNFEKPGSMVTARPCFGVGETWMSGQDFFEEIPESEWAASEDLRMNDWYGPLRAMAAVAPDEELNALLTGDPYPIKAVWLETCNVTANMGAEVDKIMRGLQGTEFNVTVDLFMTPTAMATADLFLPACTFFERIGLTGHQPYQLGAIQQCIQPLGESKSDMQILMYVMDRFYGSENLPWKDRDNIEGFFDYILRKTPFTYDDMRQRTWAYPPFEYDKMRSGKIRPDGGAGFNTAYGRYNFYVNFMQQFDLNPLAVFEEPYESPVTTPDLYEEYPLILVTGVRKWGLFHSEHRQCPSMRQLHPRATSYLNSKTATKYGVETGDRILIENRYGSCTQHVEIDDCIKDDMLYVDHGWWYPERACDDGTYFGVMEENINRCLPMTPGKTGLGCSYKTQLCKITKVPEDYVVEFPENIKH